MGTLKKKFIYNVILTLSNYIFPLLTYPYVSRVLGVNGIGFCAYVDSIINVVSLFAMMGISFVGLRAIAQNRDNKEKMSRIFSNLFVVNLILCLVVLLIFNIGLLFVDNLHIYTKYILWGEFKIVFNVFLIEWLYRGVEDFKYITIRSIIVKFLYVIMVFLLVRDESDMFAYYLLSIVMVAGNFVFNWIHKSTYVSFRVRGLSPKKYLKKIFSMGVYTILTSIYATFNITMLGFLCGDIEVGYYNTSLKIFTILASLFSALSNVLIPRMSYMVSKASTNSVQEKINQIFYIVFTFVFPLAYFFYIYAEDCVLLMSGHEFINSMSSLRVLMLLFIPFVIDQILVLQVLLPYKRDRAILYNSLTASIVAVILIFIIVPSSGAVGTAVVLLISEVIIMILSIIYIKKRLNIKLPFQMFFSKLSYSLVYFVIFCVTSLIDIVYIRIVCAIILATLYFLLERIRTKDIVYQQMTKALKIFAKGTKVS